jgi:Protein of unknown function (DUF1524)
MLSWSVRFLIAGGGGGGNLDRHYGLRAMEINEGKIKTAKALRESMADVAPIDTVFERAFANANVKRAPIARYYLRSIEMYLEDETNPQIVPSEDTNAVNLEHVLPVTPSQDWKVTPEVAAAYYKRLGNMVLLDAEANAKVGNRNFDEKKKIYAVSPFEVTKPVAKFKTWGPDEIDERQKTLAKLAPKIWPLTWK